VVELIALSRCVNQALYIRNFLIQQGYPCGPVTLYQDNMSCMALVERGRLGAERTRHIDIRYYWLKESVTNGEAVVKQKGTVDMYANMLTKPQQGQQFLSEREALTGWARVYRSISFSIACYGVALYSVTLRSVSSYR
jgi:hypothetical protein